MRKISNVNNQFLLSLAIIALGYFSKKVNILKEEDSEGISRVVLNLTLPSLIIVTFNSMKIDTSLILLAVIGLSFGCMMSVLGLWMFRKENRKLRGTLSMLVPGFNVGLFAYPLVESIWGSKGIKYIGLFDMGNSVPVFVFCYIIASYFSLGEGKVQYKSIFKKVITSIPLMSYVITLAVNLSGLHYPSPVVNICSIISKANMPLSLLLLGLCLNFSIDKAYLKNMIKILAVRYGIGLTLGIILFFVLPFDTIFRHIALIGLVLPICLAVVPYSIQFNYDSKLVGMLCNISMIISFLLVWAIIVI